MTASGRAIPRLVQVTSRDDHTIDADPAHWRAVLYRDLIQAGDPDVPITFEDCLRVLADHQLGLPRGSDAARPVVTAFLEMLVLRGLLRRPPNTSATADAAGYQLLGDLAAVPDPAAGRGPHTADRTLRSCIKCGYTLAPDVYPPDRDRHHDCDWAKPTGQRGRS